MVNSSTTGRRGLAINTPGQMTAFIFGVVFLLVGIAGFIPGITTNYGLYYETDCTTDNAANVFVTQRSGL